MAVQSVPNGAHGFDANAVLTQQHCEAAREQGFAFAIRYVSRGGKNSAGDLSASETRTILASGLGLMAVQHVESAGWMADAALGQAYGKNAAANAISAGLDPGINLWVDLEGLNRKAAADDVIAYCNAWAGEAAAAGFVPGVYVGANAILSGDQLYWQLKLKHYWKSGSTVPDIPHRGYQLVQRIVSSDAPFGVEIDRDVALTDAFGDTALMMV